MQPSSLYASQKCVFVVIYPFKVHNVDPKTKKVRGQFVCQVLIFQFENLYSEKNENLFDNLIRSTFLFHNWDNVLSFNFLEKYSALSSSVSSFNHNFYSTLQINSEFEWDLKHEAAELTPFL